MGRTRQQLLRTAVVGVVVVLLAGACGSSGNEEPANEEPREAALLDQARTLFQLPDGDPVAGVRVANCPGSAARSVCMYVVNSMFDLTGPNQWSQNGKVSLTYSNFAAESGIMTGAYSPPTSMPNNPDASVWWRMESEGMFTGSVGTVYYGAPRPYPTGERVGFYGSVPYSGGNTFECRDGTYLRCRVAAVSGTEKDAIALYEVTNAPVVVRITNRLGTQVAREGEAATTSFVAVPAAGNPTSVAPNGTAYAGGYRSISQDSRYTATYVVGDAEPNLGGARAVANIIIDPKTGADKGSKCEVSNPRSTGTQLQCKVSVSGGESGVVYADVTLLR